MADVPSETSKRPREQDRDGPAAKKAQSAREAADLGAQLIKAAQEGSLDEVRALVAAGTSLRTVHKGHSVLCCACGKEGSLAVVQYLLAQNADPNYQWSGVLRWPASLEDWTRDLDPMRLTDSEYAASGTPLHLAVDNGNLRVTKALLAAGASVGTRGSTQGAAFTAFDWAVFSRRAEMVALFAEHAVLVHKEHVSLAAYDVPRGKSGHPSGGNTPTYAQKFERAVRLGGGGPSEDFDTCTLLGALIIHAQSTPHAVLDLRIAELRLAVGCAIHARLGSSATCRATLGSLAPDLQQNIGERLTNQLMRLEAQRGVVAHWRADPARASRVAELARTAHRLTHPIDYDYDFSMHLHPEESDGEDLFSWPEEDRCA